jgi:hypothetical protein
MKKELCFFGLASLLLAGLALSGCSTSSGGSGGGSAVVTPETATFDVNNLPSAKYWNDLGSRKSLPSLFRFANGKSVSSSSDWTTRRTEIDKILQYYEYGEMPPVPTGITYADAGYTGTASERTGTTVITMTQGQNTATLTVGVVLPAGDPPTGGFPAVIYCNAANSSTWEQDLLTQHGYALISYNVSAVYDESTRDGAVATLFGYDYTHDADAPSSLMGWAWGVSRIMDVMEKGGFGGSINPEKLVVSGISRWGKAALVIGAFAQSQQGTQIAVTNPGSAGSGGPALERFLSPAGIDSSSTTIEGAKGKTLYLRPISDDHAAASADAYVAVLPSAAQSTDIQYNGWTDASSWGGIQTLAEARAEVPSWFSLRFQQFEDLHYGLNLDYASDQPSRAPHGYLDTTPFDQHFLTALVAPRGLLIHDGYQTFRNNPESQYLNFLAVDEVYQFLGAANSLGIKIYNIPHSQPEYEIEDLIDFSNAYFAGTAPAAKFRTAPYPMNDSRSLEDYERLNWARPGSTSVADQVKASAQ